MARHGRAFPIPRQRVGKTLTSDIVFDQSGNSGDQNALSSYTFNRTVGANPNRYLDFAVAVMGSNTSVTSVTDDNLGTPISATFIGGANDTGGFARIEFWRVVAPVAGTKQVSVVLSGSADSVTMWASYWNVHQTTPTEAFATHQDSSSPASCSVTPIADRCWGRWACSSHKVGGSIAFNQTPRSNVPGSSTNGTGLDADTGGLVTPPATVTGTVTYTGLPQTSVTAGYAIRPITASAGGAFNAGWAYGATSGVLGTGVF